MNPFLFGAAFITIGSLFGTIVSQATVNPVNAQSGPSRSSGDALWHLTKFGEQGWFIRAHNGMVRACNMDKANVVGDKQDPGCSNWE